MARMAHRAEDKGICGMDFRVNAANIRSLRDKRRT
jgi:hypothetical protein